MSAQHDLSPRESETAELAALGLSCREIGERLYVSLGTVKTHLAHVYAKLGVKNRVAESSLVAVALVTVGLLGVLLPSATRRIGLALRLRSTGSPSLSRAARLPERPIRELDRRHFLKKAAAVLAGSLVLVGLRTGLPGQASAAPCDDCTGCVYTCYVPQPCGAWPCQYCYFRYRVYSCYRCCNVNCQPGCYYYLCSPVGYTSCSYFCCG
jgi:DNA-binding CsgD family transcriptional regulator